MTKIAVQALPPEVSRETLMQLADDQQDQETHLQAVIQRIGSRYGESLPALEARLARGEGREHPDWENSVQWRNAVEGLHRARMIRRVLEWLLGSIVPAAS